MPEIVNCPKCSKKLRVPDTLLGKTVTCPGCGKVFTAATDEAPAPEAVQKGPTSRRAAPPPREEEEDAERPARKRPRDEDEEDEDERPRRRKGEEEDEQDEDERPRRRRREGDDEEDEDERPRRRRRSRDEDEDDRPRRRGRGRARAEAAAKGPGIALLIVGILGLLIGGVYLVQAISGHTLVNPGHQDEPPRAALWVGAVITLIWGAVVTLGGVKMMQLQSRSSVMVASIFAMLPCNPCCLAGLPIGIWALVVLARPDVKDAFG